jgi:hypothetical protein
MYQEASTPVTLATMAVFPQIGMPTAISVSSRGASIGGRLRIDELPKDRDISSVEERHGSDWKLHHGAIEPIFAHRSMHAYAY